MFVNAVPSLAMKCPSKALKNILPFSWDEHCQSEYKVDSVNLRDCKNRVEMIHYSKKIDFHRFGKLAK